MRMVEESGHFNPVSASLLDLLDLLLILYPAHLLLLEGLVSDLLQHSSSPKMENSKIK